MVSIGGCKHLCILRDIDCKINGTVNHQSKALIYKMPEATRTCFVFLSWRYHTKIIESTMRILHSCKEVVSVKVVIFLLVVPTF